MAIILRVVDAAGTPAYHEWPPFTPFPPGAIRVARRPGPGEDFVNGAWRTDHKAVADAEAGHAHVAEARALKYLEALQIVSPGPPLATGLLALEAKERGITPLELAKMVLAKRVPFIVKEVKRQRAQAGNHDEYKIPPADPLAGLADTSSKG